MRKNAAWVILMFFSFNTPVCGQQVTDEEAVTVVIFRLFKGMQLGDSAMVGNTFTNRPELVRVYRDKNHDFSHCGVDSFHLFKSKEDWKIFHLADTRRKTDCNIPD